MLADCASACTTNVRIKRPPFGQAIFSSKAKCMHKLLQVCNFVHSVQNNFSLDIGNYTRNLFSIQLVESIPEGLIYPDGSPSFMSTFDAWNHLFDLANHSIDIGSFYWTLRGADFYNHTSAWQGEKIFEKFLAVGSQRKMKIRITQSAPSSTSPNIDTEIFVKRRAAEVRSVNFERLLGGGVLHTKLWIVDQQHM